MCCYRSLVFNCCFKTDISQGSVATHLRCGWIFSDNIITNYLLILTVKKVWNWWSYKAYKNFWGYPARSYIRNLLWFLVTCGLYLQLVTPLKFAWADFKHQRQICPALLLARSKGQHNLLKPHCVHGLSLLISWPTFIAYCVYCALLTGCNVLYVNIKLPH